MSICREARSAIPARSSDSDLAVQTVNLTKSYGTPASPVHALRGVSLTIGRGERVALLGKSGSGKSTLLNLLGGLDQPTSGKIIVAGRDLAQLDSRELSRYRLTRVGIIFQAYNLIATRTALENVELPMIFAGHSPAERRAIAREALVGVGLEARLSHRPIELSGGEQQRVAIARALVNRPDLLLADEPTGNLDSATAGEILDILNSHLDAYGTTLIVVTHDDELGRRCASRTLHMRDGLLVA